MSVRIRIAGCMALLGVIAIAIALASPGRNSEAGSFTTQSLAGPLEPVDLVDSLVGGGVTTSNVSFVGADVAGGTFSGGLDVLGAFDSGVILSTGNVGSVVPPNQFDDVTTANGTLGDAQLTALAGNDTEDAAILEFDFVPASDTVVFRFVFASDEYNEFVNTKFNDVFAFFISGVNCAYMFEVATSRIACAVASTGRDNWAPNRPSASVAASARSGIWPPRKRSGAMTPRWTYASVTVASRPPRP